MGIELGAIVSGAAAAYSAYSSSKEASKQRKLAEAESSRLASEQAQASKKAEAERARLNQSTLRATKGRIKGGLFGDASIETPKSTTLG